MTTYQNVTPTTEAQIELYQELSFLRYPEVEQAISVLPTEREREHFRKLYLKKYHAPITETLITPTFSGNGKQITRTRPAESKAEKIYHANQWLKQALTNSVEKVLAKYRYNLESWAKFAKNPMFIHQMARLAVQKETAKKRQSEKELLEILQATFNTTTNKKGTPFYQYSTNRLKTIAHELALCFESIQKAFITQMVENKPAQGYSEEEKENAYINLYCTIAQLCEEMGFSLTEYEKIKQNKKFNFEKLDKESIQTTNKDFWYRKLKKAQIQMQEHIRIACGEVSRQTSIYVSWTRLNEFKGDRKEQYDYIKDCILINEDDPEERLDLWDIYLKSSSNPQKRSVEISVQNNGIMKSLNINTFLDYYEETVNANFNQTELTEEERQILEEAKENGMKHAGNYQPVFFTLTAPSKYHAIQSRTGELNPNWNGCSPKKTHEYLNNVWKRFRAQMSKYNIKLAGLRVAEPHHDGTPHWHLLLHASKNLAQYQNKHAYIVEETLHWAEPNKYPNAKPLTEWQVMIYYFKQQAYKEDGTEAGAKAHRFNYKVLEKRTYKDEDGNEREVSPAVYMVKYIRKNIPYNNLSGELSDEMLDLNGNPIDNAKNLKETALNAACWASTWGIRQFQFIGNTQIGVYRQARQYKGDFQDCDNQTKAIIKTADKSDFGLFLLLKGKDGVFTKRKEQHLTLHYEEKETAQGLTYKKVNGIQLMQNKLQELNEFIRTRLKKWIIKRKPKNQPQEEQHTASKVSPPWDCVSNCNHPKKAHTPEQLKKWTEQALKGMEILEELLAMKGFYPKN